MPEGDRSRVLRYAYEQVLDATKHQDDKINRLLTAIAFLTGGALAVAALGGAEFLTRPYEFGRYETPLSLVTVGVFFVGVVGTVLMLVGSLTTPLRLPSVPAQRNRRDPGPKSDRPVYASVDAKASPIYFFEISKLSLGQWQTKWSRRNEGAIAEEELSALARETHNLAVRTEFKYTRTNEAVAVLSFALSSLAIAAVLVLVAAAYPTDRAVPFEVPARTATAIVIGGYVWLQLRVSMRHRIQTVEELYWVSSWRRRSVRFWFPTASAAVPIFLLSVSSDSRLWLLLLTGTAVLPLALFWRIRADEREKNNPVELDWPLIGAGTLAIVYAGVGWASAATGHPEIRLFAAYGTTVVVLVAAFVASYGRTRKRLDDFKKSISRP